MKLIATMMLSVLVESRTTPSGVAIQTYRPAGRATFGTVGE